jgi:hypothetical protein
MYRIGMKRQKPLTIGNKIMVPSTIGNKITRTIMQSSKSPSQTNIYNHGSNNTDMQYMPIGLKKMPIK